MCRICRGATAARTQKQKEKGKGASERKTDMRRGSRGLTQCAHGHHFAHHSVAQDITAHHLELVGGSGGQAIDGHLGAARGRHGNRLPVIDARLPEPDRIVLLVFRSATVSWQPLQRYRGLGGLARDIVGRMRLGALDYQLGYGHQGGHFVGDHALIVAKVLPPQILNGDITPGDLDAIAL